MYRTGRRKEISENKGIGDEEFTLWWWVYIWWEGEENSIETEDVEIFQRQLYIEKGTECQQCLYNKIRRSVDQLGLGLQTEMHRLWLGALENEEKDDQRIKYDEDPIEYTEEYL